MLVRNFAHIVGIISPRLTREQNKNRQFMNVAFQDLPCFFLRLYCFIISELKFNIDSNVILNLTYCNIACCIINYLQHKLLREYQRIVTRKCCLL